MLETREIAKAQSQGNREKRQLKLIRTDNQLRVICRSEILSERGQRMEEQVAGSALGGQYITYNA